MAADDSENASTGARSFGEDAVRERAYQLWELDGRPEGRAEEHWRAAEEQLRPNSTPPEPADPHPSDEDAANVYNPSPGGDDRVEGREGDLEADPRFLGSPA